MAKKVWYTNGKLKRVLWIKSKIKGESVDKRGVLLWKKIEIRR